MININKLQLINKIHSNIYIYIHLLLELYIYYRIIYFFHFFIFIEKIIISSESINY